MSAFSLCLIVMFPVFLHLLALLDPSRIIEVMEVDARQILIDLAETPEGKAASRCNKQCKVVVTVLDRLSELGVRSLESQQKVVAAKVILALRGFLVWYVQNKQALPHEWFRVPPWLRRSPDFVSLVEDSFDGLEKSRTWLECKLLKRYLALFTQSLHQIKDVCYLLALSTTKIGDEAVARSDVALLNEVVRVMNTYMRFAINAKDIRTLYNILLHYRILAEHTLESPDPIIAGTALSISNHILYYSKTCYDLGMPFISEVAAFDLGELCITAHKMGSPLSEKLLSVMIGFHAGTIGEFRAHNPRPDRKRGLPAKFSLP